MGTPSCAMCGNDRLELIDTLSVSSLAKLYFKILDQNIGSEFGNHLELQLLVCKECDLRFFSPFVAGSEKFYTLLQKNDWYYLEEKNEYQYASKYIKPLDQVLDIGCGSGNFSEKISSPNFTGLELNREAASRAEKKGLKIVQSTVEDHAKGNSDKYDIVSAFQVIEHVSDIKSFIESSVLCLKPGGYFIISVPSVNSFSRLVTNFTLDLPPHHLSRWSDQALANINKYFPLEIVEIWHEPLQEVHKIFYFQTILMNSWLKLRKKAFKNIDLNFSSRIVSFLGWHLAKILAAGMSDSDLFPRGISVTAVFRKI